MGRRTRSETVTKIIFALLERRTWQQAELARRVGVSARTIKTRMLELSEAGVPLEREVEHPHVYWSVARSWFPGGGVLEAQEIAQLSRLLARHPKTDIRERLLEQLLRSRPRDGLLSVNSADLGLSAETLSVIEDAAAGQQVLHMSYFSASRGDLSERDVSVHRVEYGPAIRLVATCHRDDQLKWFRADRVENPRLDPSVQYRPASAADIDDFVHGSFDGFRGSGATRLVEFTIRWPEGRWAVRNLPAEAAVIYRQDSVHVAIHTSGVEALARHLVGLGELVCAETPELRRSLVELARGALRANEEPVSVNARSVRPIRPTQ